MRANGAPLPRSRGARGSGDSDGRRTPRGHRGPLVVDVRVRTRPRKRILTSPVAVEVGTARRAGTAPQPPPSPSRRRRRRRRGRTCRAMVGRDPVLGHVDGGSVRPALAAARRNVVAPVNGDYGATKQKQRRVELSRLVLWWCRICVVEYDPFFVNSGRARAANLLRLGFVFHLVLSTSTTHVLIRRCSCDTTNGDYCYCLTMTTKERNIHRGVTAPTLYWT